MSKIKVGFFSFTEITDPEQHRAYNEWHQLDHMPEQFPLDGIAYGQRWVSTPACRAARTASEALLDPIHYVTLYLVSEPVERTLQEFMQLGRDLYKAGRWFDARKSHLSGPFPLVATAVVPRVAISAAAVPYRPHRGVWVAVQDVDAPAVEVDACCAVEGVAGAWTFADATRRVTVAWIDGDPIAVSERLPVVAGAQLVGPFLTVTPWEWDWFDTRP